MLIQITDNRNRLFWSLQLGGWLAFGLLDYLIGIEINGQPADYFIPSLLYAMGGLAITSGLRLLFREIWDLKPSSIVLLGGLGALAASTLFSGFRAWVHGGFYGTHRWGQFSAVDYFNLWDLTFSLYVVATWSALYFGVRYYRTVQDQKVHLLRATSMAQEAQLKMLRYQLNPHFLFNTLNAISTLVLERDHAAANEMLTRLGTFLRHSLHSDPMRKITLEAELESLRLYLEIEEVRFEDRLHVVFGIQPEAYPALVPSLLLQPLIENAIKHAIAVSEDGGTIRITATVEGDKLWLGVSDTGAGPSAPIPPASQGPSGVGLKNTRDRLAALYGARHELDLQRLEPCGLAVSIGIPFESSDRHKFARPDRR